MSGLAHSSYEPFNSQYNVQCFIWLKHFSSIHSGTITSLRVMMPVEHNHLGRLVRVKGT